MEHQNRRVHRTTRRRFLGQGSALAAASALVGAAPAVAGAGAEAARPARVRIGVVGTGARGTALLRSLLRFPEADVRAVCDRVRGRAERAASIVREASGTAPAIHAGTDTEWETLVGRDDLDAVIVATPWEWHATMAVRAMRAGKRPGVEVPAAITIDECRDLVRTSRETGVPCTMLENVCYYEQVMALRRMVEEGLFGEVQHCEAGYQHDCRQLMFDGAGELTWRGRHVAELDGNLYPTHPFGPVAQWMGIGRADPLVSLTSLSTPARALRHHAIRRFGPDHPAARREYALGDVNTTLLRTASGRTVALYLNLMTHRPYDLILRLEGVRGIYLGTTDSICLESMEGSPHEWRPFAPYRARYEHPLWREHGEAARRSGGHGGAEHLMFHDFLEAARSGRPASQDAYDAATWSAIFPLSIASVAKGGQPVEFPDFREAAEAAEAAEATEG